MSEFFAMASRDELWSRGALVETRLTHGQAHQSGTEIIASDSFDDRGLRDELRRACDAGGAIQGDIARLTDARIRMVTTATYGGSVAVQTTIVVTIADVSVVTTPENLESDHAALARLLAPAAARYPDRPLPIVWRNGSGAVLLHEAAGHAAEHQHPPLSWPRWLRASRREIARALIGAEGRPQRYPGVICSREGQELFVASHAPLLVTAELA